MAKQNATSTDQPVSGKGSHRATFSRDKKNPGKFLVRVVGPYAEKFENREVPVQVNDGTTKMTKLTRAIASGEDDGKIIPADKGKKWVLYHFEQAPREQIEAEF